MSKPRARSAWLRGLVSLLLTGLVVTSSVAHAQTDRFGLDSVSSRSVNASSDPAAGSGPLGAVRDLLFGSKPLPELLPPEEAFRIAVKARDRGTLIAELTPASGYYLYRDRISFSVIDPPGRSVTNVSLPAGEPKADPTFGSVQVFHQPFEAVISLSEGGTATDKLQLQASYQGCNEPRGVCYPPIEKVVTVSFASVGAIDATRASIDQVPTASWLERSSDDAYVRGLFAGGIGWSLLAAFFGFGLLLAFTPCMLPMIPILSGVIVGQGVPVSRARALGLSALYVLGMAITYALAGVAAGLAGTMLSAYLQSPWVLGLFALVFVVLALSMFGLYDLQVPVAVQSRIASVSSRMKGGKAVAAFLMGVLSAVIVGPCVAAPLAGALLYIGQTGDVVLGGTALFAMALGMGVPLIVIGATAGSLLPKAGVWTEAIKRVFGVGMLAVAVYLISPVIPIVAQQLLWAALLIVPAIFLHALDPLPPDARGYRRLAKGVGVLALLMGAALMAGALSGHRDLLQPLAGFRGSGVEQRELAFQPIHTLADLESKLAAAQGQPVMLDFWAEWCVSCKEMDRFTFSDPRVQSRLREALLLRADVTANTADHRALLERFSLFGPPGIVFFDRQGREIERRVIGYQPPDQFLASLAKTGMFDPLP